jgi:hypothetical protein
MVGIVVLLESKPRGADNNQHACEIANRTLPLAAAGVPRA